MDQTNSIVGLFQNMQDNPSSGGRGRHQKSPEMAFLKRASQMTGTGPWSVTKGKRNSIRSHENSRRYKVRSLNTRTVAQAQKQTVNRFEHNPYNQLVQQARHRVANKPSSTTTTTKTTTRRNDIQTGSLN